MIASEECCKEITRIHANFDGLKWRFHAVVKLFGKFYYSKTHIYETHNLNKSESNWQNAHNGVN